MAIPGKLKELVPFASRVSKETKATVSLDALYEDFENDIFNYSADDLKLLSTVYTQDYDLRNYNTEYNRRGFMKIAEDESSEMHLCAAEILKKELNNFKGWSCEAGRENLVILEDSKVYRCYGKVGGPIGSIIDKEFKLPNSPVICSREKCFSGFDIQCTKIVQSAN